jgi:hypothetical protein
MKKLMMMAVLMMTALTVSAQPGENKLTIKPAVGVNFATFASDKDAKTKTGFTLGAEAEYGETGNMSLSLGVFYSQMGAKQSLANYKDDLSYNIDYIALPLLQNYYLAQGFAIKAGVQGGINIRKKVSMGSESMDLNDFFKAVNPDTKLKTFDAGIVLGLSYEVKGVTLDARYYMGTTKILKNFDDKNSVFSLTIGYKFNVM